MECIQTRTAITLASFWARSKSTLWPSSFLALSMARRASVKSPLVSSLMTCSSSSLYSGKATVHRCYSCCADACADRGLQLHTPDPLLEFRARVKNDKVERLKNLLWRHFWSARSVCLTSLPESPPGHPHPFPGPEGTPRTLSRNITFTNFRCKVGENKWIPSKIITQVVLPDSFVA